MYSETTCLIEAEPIKHSFRTIYKKRLFSSKPAQGPGGPILLIGTSTDSFSYSNERAEGTHSAE